MPTPPVTTKAPVFVPVDCVVLLTATIPVLGSILNVLVVNNF